MSTNVSVWFSAALLTVTGLFGAPVFAASEVVYSSTKSYDENNIFKRITPVVGMTYSGFDGQATEQIPASSTLGSIFGFTGGATIDLGVSQFVVETGLVYRRVGALERGADTSSLFGAPVLEEWDEYLYLDYLSIPVLAKYYFMDQKRTAVYAKVGLTESFLLNTTLTRYSNLQTRSRSTSDSLLEKTEMGLQAGAGVTVPVEKRVHMTFEVNYLRSLLTIKKGESLYNSTWTGNVGVAYTF